MNKEKIILLLLSIVSIVMLFCGISIIPIAKVKIVIFRRVFLKDIYFKDISDNAIYVFLILSLITIIFLFVRQKIVAVAASILSCLYMVREIYKLYNTYSKLAEFKDNINICFGMSFVVVSNMILLIMSIYIYIKSAKSMKL